MRSARKSSRAEGCSRKRAWCSSASCASGQRLWVRTGRGTLHEGKKIVRHTSDQEASISVREREEIAKDRVEI